jgi:hypothetical protein
MFVWMPAKGYLRQNTDLENSFIRSPRQVQTSGTIRNTENVMKRPQEPLGDNFARDTHKLSR